MSVTFWIEGVAIDHDDPRTFVNVSNLNARDLLDWLGYVAGPCLSGSLDSRELAARCRRRLWDEPRNQDAAIPPESMRSGRVVICGRLAGTLRTRCEDLLKLAEGAQGRRVLFG